MKPSSLIKRFERKISDYSGGRVKPRLLRVESLEDRDLLSVSAAEFSLFDTNNERQDLGNDVCLAPALQNASLATIDSSGNLECSGCLEKPAELIIADLQSFDAVIDDLLTGAGQDIEHLTKNFFFSLNSCLESNYTIYLDFNGNEYEGSEWNNNAKVTTPPYDTQVYPYNGDDVVPYDLTDESVLSQLNEFTNSELRDIYEIWYRVSEDFMPFNINVTTQEPDNDQFADNTHAIRVAIGGTCYDWYKTPGQQAAGGVANSDFNSNSSAPCYVFPWELYAIDDSNNGQKYIFPKFVADTISHEVGHTLGLNHDGRTAHDAVAAEAYYQGADNWAPLMGNAWYQDLTQWSKSEYQYANNNQDELDIITTSNGFGYRDDDHGDTIATATPLSFDNSGALVYNASELVSGIIERNTDVDFFSFNLNGEKTVIKIGGVRSATNLDVLVNLYKANGELVEPVKTYDPLDTFYVAIDTKDLEPGLYYLGVAGTGRTVDGVVHYTDYGSLGAYTITTDPFFDAYEPNNSNGVAYNLGLVSGEKTFNNAYVGGETGENDYYLLTIGSGANANNYVRVNYRYKENACWVYLRLYEYKDNAWKTKASSHSVTHTNGVETYEEVSLENLSAGTYLIRVFNCGEIVDHQPTVPPDDKLFPYTLTINAPEVTLSTYAPTIGETITTSVSPEDAYVRYQWYRTSSDSVTTPIEGATEYSYMATAEDAGCYLTVKAFGINCYEETFSATTVAPVWGIAVTCNDEDGNENGNHTNDFNADGTPKCISLREAYDYVNRYFVGTSFDGLNNLGNWRRVTDESALSYNASTGQYYYVDDGKCYVVFKTITFADDVRNVSITSELETSKSFTIKGVVDNNGVGVSISPAFDDNTNAFINSRIFNVQSGSIVAENLVLKNGNADNGGALQISTGASFLAKGCAFENNNAVNGGAVYNAGTFAADAGKFTSNVASYRGGAIANKGVVNITGASSFTNNLAQSASDATKGTFGGAIYNNGATASVTVGAANAPNARTTFSGNQATAAGSPAVSNEVLNGYSGGAIYNSKGTITAYNVDFDANFAGKYGGAISNFATLNVSNSKFYSNVASAGGAVQTSGDATFTNTTFGGERVDGNTMINLGNTALKSKYLLAADSADYGGNGGAIFASGVGKSVTFNGATTFVGNQAANAGGAIDYISGSLAFDRNGFTAPEATSDLKCLTITNNKARTIGGAAVFAGAVVFVDYDDVVNNEKTDVTISGNSVGTVADPDSDTTFHKATGDDGGVFSPVVAVTYNVGETEIQNIGTYLFDSTAPARTSLDTFARYSVTAYNQIGYEDLVGTFSSRIGSITVSYNGLTTTLTETNNATIQLNNDSNTIYYWDTAQSSSSDVAKYRANILVDGANYLSVVMSQFDLTDRDYISTSDPSDLPNALAVGVSVQICSSQPVSKWTLQWGQGSETTINSYGFTCNAYHIYTEAATYTPKLVADGTPYDLGELEVKAPTQGTASPAVLDTDLDVFSDSKFVNELFEE
ncbi:MAG: hypothetical protein IKX88_05915 [Thermoguttaceae bacterium]|nr:hypothetical protein [Thermoguttaceae bacterium]